MVDHSQGFRQLLSNEVAGRARKAATPPPCTRAAEAASVRAPAKPSIWASSVSNMQPRHIPGR
jgi:hypothetical protein